MRKFNSFIGKILFAALGGISAALTSTAIAQNTTTYTYDSNYGQMHSLTTPGVGSAMTYQYDTQGLDVEVPQTGGNTTRYQYDSNYNQTGTTSSTGSSTSTTYDSSSGGVTMTDTSGPNTTTYVYDNNNNLVTSYTDPGDVTSSAYDALNNRVVESEPGTPGNTTTNAYDAAGNVVTSIDSVGTPDTTAYDSLDRIVSVTTDALGATITYDYDANNNYAFIHAYTDPGHVTAYTYDAVGRPIVAVPDNNGLTTIYQYDAVGSDFVPETTVPGNVISMAYDTVGNRLFVTSVPEPATMGILALASIGILKRRAR